MNKLTTSNERQKNNATFGLNFLEIIIESRRK